MVDVILKFVFRFRRSLLTGEFTDVQSTQRMNLTQNTILILTYDLGGTRGPLLV